MTRRSSLWIFHLLFLVSKLRDEDTDENTEAAHKAADTTKLKKSFNQENLILLKLIVKPTLMIAGIMSNRLRGPAMVSGSAATDSNQNTGNIISGTSLNRYLIPSTLRMKTFSWSLISTLTGMDDVGSTQKLLS
jgi:hypothetical protein